MANGLSDLVWRLRTDAEPEQGQDPLLQYFSAVSSGQLPPVTQRRGFVEGLMEGISQGLTQLGRESVFQQLDPKTRQNFTNRIRDQVRRGDLVGAAKSIAEATAVEAGVGLEIGERVLQTLDVGRIAVQQGLKEAAGPFPGKLGLTAQDPVLGFTSEEIEKHGLASFATLKGFSKDFVTDPLGGGALMFGAVRGIGNRLAARGLAEEAVEKTRTALATIREPLVPTEIIGRTMLPSPTPGVVDVPQQLLGGPRALTGPRALPGPIVIAGARQQLLLEMPKVQVLQTIDDATRESLEFLDDILRGEPGIPRVAREPIESLSFLDDPTGTARQATIEEMMTRRMSAEGGFILLPDFEYLGKEFANLMRKGGSTFRSLLQRVKPNMFIGDAPERLAQLDEQIFQTLGRIGKTSEQYKSAATELVKEQLADQIGILESQAKALFAHRFRVQNNLKDLGITALGDPEAIFRATGGERGQQLWEAVNAAEKAVHAEHDDLITKLTAMFKGVKPRDEADKRIFDFLNGDIPSEHLRGNELGIAESVRSLLDEMADRLKLAPEMRRKNYITNLYKKVGDSPEMFINEGAGVGRAPRDVFNRYLLPRTGNDPEFLKRSTIEALDAYIRPALAKIYFDPVLEQKARLFKGTAPIGKIAKEFGETGTVRAPKIFSPDVVRYVDETINLAMGRPSNLSRRIRAKIKSLGEAAGLNLSGNELAVFNNFMTGLVYQGTLGFNAMSAVVNLVQNLNTLARVRSSSVATAVRRFRTKEAAALVKEIGVSDNAISDTLEKNLNPTLKRKLLQKEHEAAFYLFNAAEKFNRSIAGLSGYYDAIAKGMAHEAAIKSARRVIKDTQFSFMRSATPVGFRTPELRMLVQFGRFPVGQARFLKNLASDALKGDVAPLAKYLAATGALVYGASMAGLNLDRWLGSFGIEAAVPSVSPAMQLALAAIPSDTLRSAGLLRIRKPEKSLQRFFTTLIPGGVEISRLTEGRLEEFFGLPVERQKEQKRKRLED